jgi:hypothetical protein
VVEVVDFAFVAELQQKTGELIVIVEDGSQAQPGRVGKAFFVGQFGSDEYLVAISDLK